MSNLQQYPNYLLDPVLSLVAQPPESEPVCALGGEAPESPAARAAVSGIVNSLGSAIAQLRHAGWFRRSVLVVAALQLWKLAILTRLPLELSAPFPNLVALIAGSHLFALSLACSRYHRKKRKLELMKVAELETLHGFNFDWRNVGMVVFCSSGFVFIATVVVPSFFGYAVGGALDFARLGVATIYWHFACAKIGKIAVLYSVVLMVVGFNLFYVFATNFWKLLLIGFAVFVICAVMEIQWYSSAQKTTMNAETQAVLYFAVSSLLNFCFLAQLAYSRWRTGWFDSFVPSWTCLALFSAIDGAALVAEFRLKVTATPEVRAVLLAVQFFFTAFRERHRFQFFYVAILYAAGANFLGLAAARKQHRAFANYEKLQAR